MLAALLELRDPGTGEEQQAQHRDHDQLDAVAAVRQSVDGVGHRDLFERVGGQGHVGGGGSVTGSKVWLKPKSGIPSGASERGSPTGTSGTEALDGEEDDEAAEDEPPRVGALVARGAEDEEDDL